MRFSARSTSHRHKGGLIMLSLDDRIHAAAAAPAYIYDGETVRNACARLKRDFPDVGFLYSVKTNPFAPVLREAAAQGFGADAASAGEVEKSLEAGFAPEDVYYSAPGKTDEDIERALGKCRIIADSLTELDRLERIASSRGLTLSVGLRIHPDFGIFSEAGGSSKFGIGEEDLPEAARRLREHAHLRAVGFHMHLQSQLLDVQTLARYYEKSFQCFERASELFGITPEYLNFGSGIGVVYDAASEREMDTAALGRSFALEAERHPRFASTRLLIETGRFLVCRAGFYVTPVVDVKSSRGTTYVMVRNGANGFMRGAVANLVLSNNPNARDLQEPFYTGKRSFKLLAMKADGCFLAEDPETVDVVGNLCTALDVVAKGVQLPAVRPGDFILITNAGSYAATLSPVRFSSLKPSAELYLERPGGKMLEA